MSLTLALLLWKLHKQQRSPRGTEWLLLLGALAAGASSSSTWRSPSLSSPAPRTGTPRITTWTPEDMAAFKAELGGLGVGLSELLLLFCAESGLVPHATSGSAYGLNQAQAALLKDAGWTWPAPEFCLLSVREQLPWIRKMLSRQFDWIGYVPQSSLELFRMNLSPRAAHKRSDVIYSRDADPKFYAANARLDRGGDGVIDMADLGLYLDDVAATPRFKTHLALLQGS